MLQCSDAVESILNQLIVRERDENNCHLGAKQRERSTFLQEALINRFDILTAGPVKLSLKAFRVQDERCMVSIDNSELISVWSLISSTLWGFLIDAYVDKDRHDDDLLQNEVSHASLDDLLSLSQILTSIAKPEENVLHSGLDRTYGLVSPDLIGV
ncbi:hypothetical protein Cgig2_033431 [Carnegiea gigantea]|uniref:Uncharacterized protein n=1 Tax=Carnegiea gigantea TaxID=171969 RepID=A0A9Q1QPX5_9CARY|nr:hypothetical protein Cgig2_033431 [Carnegiea gigantea]